jgi:hypothetical protein
MFSAGMLLLSQLAAVPDASSRCLRYEPVVVSLSGKLIRETFAGPPNYYDIQKGDRAETFFLLVLAKPICTSIDQNDFQNRAERSVEKLQLVFFNDAAGNYRKYRPFLGRNVQCEGKLFSAQTGHHYTPVLMIVEDCQSTPPSVQLPESK